MGERHLLAAYRLRRGPAYREMVRAVLDAASPVPAVLLALAVLLIAATIWLVHRKAA